MLEAGPPDLDNVTAIVGSKVAHLQQGRADFLIGVNPSFSRVDRTAALTVLVRQPSIVLRGLDAESLASISSESITVSLEQSKSVCPMGYILKLGDPAVDDGRRVGACVLCDKGTYSISPLAGPKDPACFPCPAGGACQGGADVHFAIGTWGVVDAVYHLLSCPPGYALVNSDGTGGAFDQALQQCVACSPDQYILNTSSSAVACQPCPVGGSCNGSRMLSLVPGAVWTADTAAGVYVLTACPPAYELLNRNSNGELMLNLQECSRCPPGYYCPGGQLGRAACPAGTFTMSGASSQDSCKPSVDVVVAVKLSIGQADFTAPLQARFREAVSDAAGVVPDQVQLTQIVQTTRRGAVSLPSAGIRTESRLRRGVEEVSSEAFSLAARNSGLAFESSASESDFHAVPTSEALNAVEESLTRARPFSAVESARSNRRQAGNKVRASCTISAPSADAASTIVSTLNQAKLNDQLTRQGLPAGSLESAAVAMPNGGQGNSVPWALVGSLVGVGALVGVIGGLWAMKGKEESEEDRELRLAVAAVRARLKIRIEDGFLLSSEQQSVVSLRSIRCIISKLHVEAAARLSLGHHFDVQQFDAFCMTMKESAFESVQQSFSFRRCPSSLPPQYMALCDWLMDISATLIRVEVDHDEQSKAERSFKSLSALSGEDGIQFFVHEVTSSNREERAYSRLASAICISMFLFDKSLICRKFSCCVLPFKLNSGLFYSTWQTVVL